MIESAPGKRSNDRHGDGFYAAAHIVPKTGLSALNLSTNTVITVLDCSSNKLSALDVSSCAAWLVELNCSDNSLTALDVSLDTLLSNLYCQNNNLTSLSTSTNTNLATLDVSGNALTALDVSHNTKLQILRCYDNNLGELDVSANTLLKELDCSNCGLSALDFHTNTELYDLYCNNNTLGSLDLSDCAKLNTLDCSSCGLNSLNITGTAIVVLVCADNNLTSLDFGDITGVMPLDISGNRFTDLDLTGLTCMVLNCTDNPLSHIKAIVYYGYSEESHQSVELTADGEGYVGLYASQIMPEGVFRGHTYNHEFYAQGTPKTAAAAFYNWTEPDVEVLTDTEVSTDARYTLNVEANYDLTAHFLSLTGSPADGKIYEGGRITLTPSMEGGTWSFDTSILSRVGTVFTGLKAGTAHVVYTLGNAAASFDVVVQSANLPVTGQSFIWVYVLSALAIITCAAALVLRRRATR